MALDTTIGSTSADSYATLAEYQAYVAAIGRSASGVDATDEANLRRAAQIIDRDCEFIGMKQYQIQSLSWPRLVNELVDDWPIDPDTVPQDIKDAQCELAYLVQGGLDPHATITAVIKSAGAGPARVEFLGGQGKPQLVAIAGLLRPYVRAGRGQARLMRA